MRRKGQSTGPWVSACGMAYTAMAAGTIASAHVGRVSAGERTSIGVAKFSCGDQHDVDDRPDAAAAEREELEQPETGVTQVKAVDTEAAEEDREQERGQELLVGDQARHVLR